MPAAPSTDAAGRGWSRGAEQAEDGPLPRPSVLRSVPPRLPYLPSNPPLLPLPVSRRRPSSSFFPGCGGSPGKCKGRGRAAAASPPELAGPRQGPRLRPALPRHIHSSGRLRGEGRVGREEERERRRRGARAEGRYCLRGRRGDSATAPAAWGRGEAAARGGSATGAGRPPAGCAPTAHNRAGGRREPVTARGGGAGRRRRQGAGGLERGYRRGRGRRRSGLGWRGVACEVPSYFGWRGGLPCGSPAVRGGGGVLRILAAPCPARGTGNPLASAGPATSVSFYDHNRCSGFKSRPGVWTAGISAAALQLPLMARSMCRKPQRQLRVASHAGPCPQLARPATPLRPSKSQPHPCGETKLSLGGRKRPAKLSRDSAFVRGNIEYAPKASQASTTSGFGGAVVELRWP